MFTDQYEPSLKTNLKVTKGCGKDNNSQDGIKLLDLIRSVVCGMGSRLQVIWAMMKVAKRLHMFFHRRNTTNNDYMKYFEAYIKVIESYGDKKNHTSWPC